MLSQTHKRGRGRPPKQHGDKAGAKNASPAAGVISVGETYTRQELQRRLGIGAIALRSAEARGLRATVLGHRKLYRGADIDLFLQQDHA